MCRVNWLSSDVLAVQLQPRQQTLLQLFAISATTGQGLEAWIAWLEEGVAEAKAARDRNVESLRRRIAELEAQLGQGRG